MHVDHWILCGLLPNRLQQTGPTGLVRAAAHIRGSMCTTRGHPTIPDTANPAKHSNMNGAQWMLCGLPPNHCPKQGLPDRTKPQHTSAAWGRPADIPQFWILPIPQNTAIWVELNEFCADCYQISCIKQGPQGQTEPRHPFAGWCTRPAAIPQFQVLSI